MFTTLMQSLLPPSPSLPSGVPRVDSVRVELEAHGHIEADTDRAHSTHSIIYAILITLSIQTLRHNLSLLRHDLSLLWHKPEFTVT